MRTVVVYDCAQTEAFIKGYALTEMQVKDCVGCFSCWKKTPGNCVFHDLDSYYRDYINADMAVFFLSVANGFISGQLKTLFDRMIPLFLPYTSWETGESMHVPRYEKYPDIKLFYVGKFESTEEKALFHDYLYRVFDQFHSKAITISPVSEFRAEELE